jgi:hypothetical protein
MVSMPAPLPASFGDRVVVVELAQQVRVDAELLDQPVMDGAQALQSLVDIEKVLAGAGEFVIQLRKKPLHHLVRGHRLGGLLFGPHAFGGAGGQAQRVAAEQDNRRGSGLPAQGAVDAQLRSLLLFQSRAIVQ